MILPKDSRQLSEIFQTAIMPNVFEFDGEYFVDMLTILPTLRQLHHRKLFYRENNTVIGYNLLFSDLRWGYFFLEESAAEQTVAINYARRENSFVSRRIRDCVRCVEKKRLYVGKFHYCFMKQARFLGYFSLTRIE